MDYVMETQELQQESTKHVFLAGNPDHRVFIKVHQSYLEGIIFGHPPKTRRPRNDIAKEDIVDTVIQDRDAREFQKVEFTEFYEEIFCIRIMSNVCKHLCLQTM